MRIRDDGEPVWQGRATQPFQLVLEGGAMRNVFTSGVVDFFLDQGLLAESTIGTSAGAVCGYNYASGAVGRTAYCDLRYRSDWRFMSLRSKLVTGDYVGARFIYDVIPNDIEHYDAGWFIHSPMQLISVACNLDTGKADYHRFGKTGDVERGAKYLQASTAVPFVNRAVHVDGKRLLDGGVCDSVPFRLGRQRYAGRQVIVLTRHRGFVQREQPYQVKLARVRYAAYPHFVDKLASWPKRYNMQMQEIERMHDAGEVFAIWPDHDMGVRMAERNPDKMLAAYEMGLACAARQWSALRHYLGM